MGKHKWGQRLRFVSGYAVPVLGRRDFERKLRRDAVKAKADAARKQKDSMTLVRPRGTRSRRCWQRMNSAVTRQHCRALK
jgi:hypothetical protein